MTDIPDNYVKIRFSLDLEEWHGQSAETLWAEPVGSEGSYAFRLLNSPYHSREASYLDVVRAVEAPDGLGLDYAGTIQASGHSTIWLATHLPSAEFKRHWAPLQSKGCTYEGIVLNASEEERQVLYSVDVPPETDMEEIISLLKEGQDHGAWSFQIGHVGRGSAPDPIASGNA